MYYNFWTNTCSSSAALFACLVLVSLAGVTALSSTCQTKTTSESRMGHVKEDSADFLLSLITRRIFGTFVGFYRPQMCWNLLFETFGFQLNNSDQAQKQLGLEKNDAFLKNIVSILFCPSKNRWKLFPPVTNMRFEVSCLEVVLMKDVATSNERNHVFRLKTAGHVIKYMRFRYHKDVLKSLSWFTAIASRCELSLLRMKGTNLTQLNSFNAQYKYMKCRLWRSNKFNVQMSQFQLCIIIHKISLMRWWWYFLMCEAVKCPAVGHPVLTSAGWVADMTVCL